MESNGFDITQDGGAHVGVVTLARPDSGNRLLTPEIRELGQAIRGLGEREDVKVVLVRANGASFCLGREPAKGVQAPKSALDIRSGVTQPILDLYADIRATPVPVIAIVQGDARGFGCAFVGQCDLAIAVDAANFAMPEMDVNLPPTLAMSAVLGKLPPKRLLHMVYTRRSIDAKEALALGLVSEVVAAAALEQAVAATVAALVDRDRAALCAVKEYMAVAPYMDPFGASRAAANMLSVVLSSQGKP